MRNLLNQLNLAGIILVALFSFAGQAITVSEDFSTATYRQSDTLVWNHQLGILHPPLQVFQYTDGTLQDKTFEVGNGGNGSFDSTRYLEFSADAGASFPIIKIDTSVYPVLEVTRFQLDAGWTLEPIGTGNLVIRSLGDVVIAGTIQCSGFDGVDMNANNMISSAGGQGRCGGGNGGVAGSTLVIPGAGTDGGPVITDGAGPGVDGPTAGGGATSAGTGGGGGGGGAYAVPRGGGLDSTDGTGGVPGLAGEMGQDNDFEYNGGGFGGGGGDYYTGGGAGQDSSGASGGGGGGQIFITAVGNITISGKVYANGGDGGDSDGTQLGGGGGGGGGGSIAMFAGGEVYLSGTAEVVAAGGLGQGKAGHRGGVGAAGRTWLVGSSGYSILVAPLVTPEFPDPLVADVGHVRYQLGTFTVSSQVFDTSSSRPTLTTVNASYLLPIGGALTISVAASSDPSFTPNWINTVGTPIELARYMKFQAVLSNTDVVSPAIVNSISFSMNAFEQSKFEMVSACGGTHSQPAAGGILFLLPILVLIALRRRATF